MVKPIRITFEFEDAPEGTRVTEYWKPHAGLGQRMAFAMSMRMLADRFTESQESLRSMLAAAESAE